MFLRNLQSRHTGPEMFGTRPLLTLPLSDADADSEEKADEDGEGGGGGGRVKMEPGSQ